MSNSRYLQRGFYLRCVKPLFDWICAFLGLVLLLPLFFIITLGIKLTSTGPVFFGHERVGKCFTTFKLYKFRSMVDNADGIGPAVTQGGDKRVTQVGKLLRKYKLDELPQLYNVLKGEISLVGPRPEVEKYVRMFTNDYEQILKIRPGITDYAALKYRHEEEILASYDDLEQGYVHEVLPAKIALYKEYMGNIGFLEDIKIIFKTFSRIF